MHSIYRVHKHLRDVNKKAYEPETIAIGPYHHGKDSLKMMEEHKTRYLHLLLKRKKQESETSYISAISKLEPRARECYAEPIRLSREKFTEILVRDGCFIIELMRKCNRKDGTCKVDPIFQMEWMMNSLQRDLILFENQIPFFVLRKLFDLIEVPGQHKRLIYLVFKFWENLYPGGECKKIIPEEISHLPDLIHQCYRPPLAADHMCIDIDQRKENMRLTRRNHLSDLICQCYHRLLGADHVCADADADASSMKRESLIIHTATELTNANVKFRKKESGPLFDVDFKEGTVRMRSLTIEDRTECFFRNLMAYEQYFPDGQPSYVTDYARLLNCLIDSSRDVEILSKSGIIDNWLGDDKVVARIVNQLTRTVSGPGKGFIYAATFASVNAHCKKRLNRSCAALKRDYCYSPWATLAVLAASVILILTITQTVCSILQVLGFPKKP